jgi:hypothetical protein
MVRLRYAEATLGGSGGEVLHNQFESCDSSGLLGPNSVQAECALQEDTYICSGRGAEVYEPVATYHGFRYVSMTGYDISHCTNGDCIGGKHKDVEGYARGLLASYLVHTAVAEVSTTLFYSFDPADNHILSAPSRGC